MTLEEILACVIEASGMLPTWKGGLNFEIEDGSILCRTYGVYLTPAEIERPGLRRVNMLPGWEVSTGGLVPSLNREEPDDYDTNIEYSTSCPHSAAQVFIQLIFRAIATEWFEIDKQERLAKLEPTPTEIEAYMRRTD